ncbi:MAG: ATPase [Bacteroidetes bacterium RIFCSPLOWO2_02_FULL_36_8]|nr:MAG: ATPase [Bacteroidetes bacterium RIFCSPLOWO2_02_FULL_36_8]OFY70749.1 MAG: ATPase [Bacteroidetes bacterium RIFCSPLOWO2_12_FULL_37_12]
MVSTEAPAVIQHTRIKKIYDEVNKVIVGQHYMVSRLLIGLFTNGHILLEGVPGLAKTLTVSTLAKALSLHFQRLQFTPDLLPADIIGTMIYNQKTNVFEVKKGPIFSNFILADEINRSPAKVQSALLEAMQEKQVTIGEITYRLDPPFLVMATQNPVEQEGTYPLPEAQVDRFMLKINIDYPTKEEELEIMRRMSDINFTADINPVLGKEDISQIRNEINQVKISSSLENYIVELIHGTRHPAEIGLQDAAKYIQYGASPRGSIYLNLVSKALAYLNDREYVLPEDVKEAAYDVLNHRIILNYEAEADGVNTRQILEMILKKIRL